MIVYNRLAHTHTAIHALMSPPIHTHDQHAWMTYIQTEARINAVTSCNSPVSCMYSIVNQTSSNHAQSTAGTHGLTFSQDVCAAMLRTDNVVTFKISKTDHA